MAEIQFKFKLTPDIQKDEDTGMYIARFKEFPQAIAYDETAQKSLLRLIEICQAMLRDKKSEIIDNMISSQLIENHKNNLDVNMIGA